jgi:hypothetical protein
MRVGRALGPYQRYGIGRAWNRALRRTFPTRIGRKARVRVGCFVCPMGDLLVDPHKALSYQRALATFTRIVGEADSEHRLLQNAVAQVARITHIRHVKVLRYRPDQGDLLVEAGVGWKSGVVGM